MHVKGHKNDEGNERVDELVQWGKTAGCRPVLNALASRSTQVAKAKGDMVH